MQINILSFTIVRKERRRNREIVAYKSDYTKRTGKAWRGCGKCHVTIWSYVDGDIWYDHKNSPWCNTFPKQTHEPGYW